MVKARRLHRYQRCLTRIERLEVELGYREEPRFSKVRYDDPALIFEMRPGAKQPIFIAPQGTMLRSNLKRQWTQEEMEQRHIDQGGTPMVWG